MLNPLSGSLAAAKAQVEIDEKAKEKKMQDLKEQQSPKPNAKREKELQGPGSAKRAYLRTVMFLTRPFYDAHVRAEAQLENNVGVIIQDHIDKSRKILSKTERCRSLSYEAIFVAEACARQAEKVMGVIERHPERSDGLQELFTKLQEQIRRLRPPVDDQTFVDTVKQTLDDALGQAKAAIENELGAPAEA